MKIHTFAAVATAVLALAGTAHAQSASGSSSGGQNSVGAPPEESNKSTLPPDQIPDGHSLTIVNTSGTGDVNVTTISTERIPTRAEVRAETRAMARSGSIPHGELSNAHQDKGGEIGATPF